MTTTYCDRDDIVAILGEAGLLAAIDDNQDGALSADEEAHITAAIERAAVEMNSSLRNQYDLADLSGNSWCKWCNATLAVVFLRSRRNNEPEPSTVEAATEFREHLKEARWGRFQIPEQAPSFEHIPTVSNFTPEVRKLENPIRVVPEESTGAAPEGGRKRHTSGQPGYW